MDSAVSEAGKVTKVAANGAVATTSMIFILEAVALGIFLKYTKFNKWINTAVAIVLLVAAIALGLNFPMYVRLGTMASHHLCLHPDCQCRSCMGTASAS